MDDQEDLHLSLLGAPEGTVLWVDEADEPEPNPHYSAVWVVAFVVAAIARAYVPEDFPIEDPALALLIYGPALAIAALAKRLLLARWRSRKATEKLPPPCAL